MSTSAVTEVVREFWRLMATNDLHSVGTVLSQVRPGDSHV